MSIFSSISCVFSKFLHPGALTTFNDRLFSSRDLCSLAPNSWAFSFTLRYTTPCIWHKASAALLLSAAAYCVAGDDSVLSTKPTLFFYDGLEWNGKMMIAECPVTALTIARTKPGRRTLLIIPDILPIPVAGRTTTRIYEWYMVGLLTTFTNKHAAAENHVPSFYRLTYAVARCHGNAFDEYE